MTNELNMGPSPSIKAITRAIVRGDIILSLTGGDRNIGQIPKGVGLERLRFDGEKVVDLITVDRMWVEDRGGVFILHCIPLPGCQLVEMTYSERHKLAHNGGGLRLLTDEEIAIAEARKQEKSRNEAFVRWVVEHTDGAVIIDAIRLLYAIILAEREPNAQIGAWLNTQVADMKATFQWSNAERLRLEKLIDALKAKMGEYYAQQG